MQSWFAASAISATKTANSGSLVQFREYCLYCAIEIMRSMPYYFLIDFMQDNLNSKSYIGTIKMQVLENLRCIQHAPSVQLQEVSIHWLRKTWISYLVDSPIQSKRLMLLGDESIMCILLSSWISPKSSSHPYNTQTECWLRSAFMMILDWESYFYVAGSTGLLYSWFWWGWAESWWTCRS